MWYGTESFDVRRYFKVRPFLVEQIFVFLKLELAHQAECFLEIYALGIVSALTLISMFMNFCAFMI